MAESLTVDGVMNALRNCYDPEIPVNIVDLGLVYNVAIDEDNVKVRMTLTTMGCPAHAYLMHQVQTDIEKIPGVKKAEVEIVRDPPRFEIRFWKLLHNSLRSAFCDLKKLLSCLFTNRFCEQSTS